MHGEDAFRDGVLLRIFVDEKDRAGGRPLHVAILELLRTANVAGATVFRGIEGFGGHGQIHVAGVFSWMPNLPILIEVVDEPEIIASVLPRLTAMITEGLITSERLRYLRISSQNR